MAFGKKQQRGKESSSGSGRLGGLQNGLLSKLRQAQSTTLAKIRRLR
jgi:hypothetical protein